jgi:hypothetical protein
MPDDISIERVNEISTAVVKSIISIGGLKSLKTKDINKLVRNMLQYSAIKEANVTQYEGILYVNFLLESFLAKIQREKSENKETQAP